MKKLGVLCGVVLTLLLMLTACTPSSKKAEASLSPTPSQTVTDSEETNGEKTVHGIINRLGSFLILLTDDGEYRVMDYGEGVTTDGLEEGDTVDITYTGTLDSEEEAPVIVSITKSN